mgnify:CR=1 FL=1
MSNNNGSVAAVGSNRPGTNVVTFPPSATSASLVQQISPALQSAIETMLAKKEDDIHNSHSIDAAEEINTFKSKVVKKNNKL